MALSDYQKKEAAKSIASARIYNLTVQFIKMPSDKNMKFTVLLNENDARKLVQSMRVKLSRFRTEIKTKGKKLADFKMRFNSLSYDPDTGVSTIILTKTAPIAKQEKEVNDLFKELNNDNLLDEVKPNE